MKITGASGFRINCAAAAGEGGQAALPVLARSTSLLRVLDVPPKTTDFVKLLTHFMKSV